MKTKKQEPVIDSDLKITQVLGLILGGGKGTRLYPPTKDRSKPAVPFGGNYRLIDIPISNCINSGINRVFVMTQFNSASLNRHIVQTYKFDIFHKGFVDLLATEQTMDNSTASGFTQGTADAVRRALKHLNTYRASLEARFVLILSGDQLYRMNFNQLFENHIKTGAEITLGIIPVGKDDLSRFGILKMEENHSISAFIEKPKTIDQVKGWEIPENYPVNKEKNYFGSMGMYLFNIDTLYDLLLTHPEMLDFGKEVIPYSIKSKYKVSGFIHNDYWEDIGTIKSFHNANLELTKKNGQFKLYDPESPFFSDPRFLPPSEIENASIERSIISDGVKIEDCTIKNSVIGVRSIIKAGTVIDNTLMIGADYYETSLKPGQIPIGIGEGTVIHNSILDKNCRIGKNVKILNESGILNREDKEYSIVDGIVVVVKNGIIPDGTVI